MSDVREGLISWGFVEHNRYACAVYVLLFQGKPIYVGRTTDVFQRLGQHLRSRKHYFDDVYLYYCEESELLTLERETIQRLQPPGNIHLKGPPKYTTRLELSDLKLGRLRKPPTE